MTEILISHPSESPFRAGFHYYNAGYTLSGLIIERLSGLSYEEFLQQRILDPLELDSTSLYGRKQSAVAYTKVNGINTEHQPFVQETGDSRKVYWDAASGGLVSSAADMTRWLTFIIRMASNMKDPSGLEISQATFQPIITPHSLPTWILGLDVDELEHCSQPTYGLAQWQIRYQDTALQHHYGLRPGCTSSVIWMPEFRSGVIVLSNEDSLGEDLVNTMGMRAVEDLAGLKRLDWEKKLKLPGRLPYQDDTGKPLLPSFHPNEKRSLPLSAYLGTYNCPLGGRLDITIPDIASQPAFTNTDLIISQEVTEDQFLDKFICLQLSEASIFLATQIQRLQTHGEAILVHPGNSIRTDQVKFIVEEGRVVGFEMAVHFELEELPSDQIMVFKKLE